MYTSVLDQMADVIVITLYQEVEQLFHKEIRNRRKLTLVCILIPFEIEIVETKDGHGYDLLIRPNKSVPEGVLAKTYKLRPGKVQPDGRYVETMHPDSPAFAAAAISDRLMTLVKWSRKNKEAWQVKRSLADINDRYKF